MSIAALIFIVTKLGFKPQLFARPINLFYLTETERIRIIVENNSFKIEGIGTFSKNEMLDLIDKHPENFSPNVVFTSLFLHLISNAPHFKR